jgi:hypothetical protein
VKLHRANCFTAGSTAQRLPSKKTVRMGDKAKPSGVRKRRRLCCLYVVISLRLVLQLEQVPSVPL